MAKVRKRGGRPPNPPKFVDPKSIPELTEALNRQVANMRRSATAFDGGHHEEAERLAASVHILCYDNGHNTRSVLSQLDRRDTMWIPDTSSTKPAATEWTLSLGPPLLRLWKEAGKVSYTAPLGLELPTTRRIIFKAWWEATIYASEKPGLRLSRKNLVLSLRNQDGGGHVDGALTDEAYSRYSRQGDHATWNTSETIYLRGGPDTPNLHWLTMRQIAWELDQALVEAGLAGALA